MLEDRDYMRQAGFDRSIRPFSVTFSLIVANLLAFVWWEVTMVHFPAAFDFTQRYFALSNGGLAHGYIWQLLTFQFLHVSPMHFACNMLGLFFLGRALEPMINGKQFLTLYLVSGLVGGVFQSLLGLLFPDYFGGPVLGASAGVCGLLAAVGTLEPDLEFLAFFILPV